ncbi:MAG: tRNA pseudouridine(55) synthase TruB [Candidatus Eisenbacteria bacterium]
MNPASSPATSNVILNVYKEVSWTSHDAVARVRRILKERRVGHAGTLDPLANGVLLMGVGKGTKLLPYLTDLPKRYSGTLVFGRRTSTGDSGGATVARGEVPEIDAATLQQAADSFLGASRQVPPMVSAIKQGGRRLYDLARKGIEVERPARPIEIFRFRIVSVELPRVDFEVECGKGTYVRTLVEDLASRVGALATVEALSRTGVGPFSAEESCRIIADPCRDKAGLMSRAISPSEALAHLPSVRIEPRWIHRVRQGGVPPRSGLLPDGEISPERPVRLLGPEHELLALGRWEMLPGPADRAPADSCTLRLERVI